MTARTEGIHAADVDGEDGVKKRDLPISGVRAGELVRVLERTAPE